MRSEEVEDVRYALDQLVLARHAGPAWRKRCRPSITSRILVYECLQDRLRDRRPWLIGKYGFAYGTLPDHGERGEERFTVELDTDQTVWYDLYAFSRPSAVARVAYPFTRLLQKRFATDSKAAMQKAVHYASK